MCKSPVHALLRTLPKCEHHVHIEGTLSPRLLFELAAANSIALPTDDTAFASEDSLTSRYSEFTSLDDFLHYYYIGMNVLQTEHDFELLAKRYLERAAQDGTAHAEIFFDPQAHLSRGIPLQNLLRGFERARAWASAELDLSTELICCFLRHLPVQDCNSTYDSTELQRALAEGIVRGIGLDSSELGFPPELFESIYQQAKSQGYRRTAHAGEEGPASNIAVSLDQLHVQRIDHGVRLAEDPKLMARVAQEQILLTVCPISNVFLRVVSSVEQLPIQRFLDAGIRFSINSDDPAYFGNHYILDNYCAVQEAFHLSVAQWQTICLNSIDGSWCTDDRKVVLRNKLGKAVRTWEQQNPGLLQ